MLHLQALLLDSDTLAFDRFMFCASADDAGDPTIFGNLKTADVVIEAVEASLR